MDKYQEALERARTIYQAYDCGNKDLEYIFPELAENEDEKIWEQIKSILEYHMQESFSPEWKQKCLDWLEKRKPLFSDQDQRDPWEYIEKFKSLYGHYPKDADEIGVIVSEMLRKLSPKKPEPKFKIGDRIIENTPKPGVQPYVITGFSEKQPDYLVDGGNCPGCSLGIEFVDKNFHLVSKFKVGDWVVNNTEGKLRHILSVSEFGYTSDHGYLSKDFYEENFHLWSIQDARKGDVLTNWNDTIFIFDKIEDGVVKYFVAYNETWDDKLKVSEGKDHLGLAEEQFEFKLATKEQRDKLFREIKLTDYEWDDKELELIKTEVAKNDSHNKIHLDWSQEDRDIARFIGNAITVDEASDYLKSKHVEVIDAHIWLDALKDRIRKVDEDQLMALSRTVTASKVIDPRDADLLMKLYSNLTLE